ncbi:FtsX-like permease family protein [Haloimpatiens sp. FM7315]|uniref:FtsX-like permease family protein n=1 Tax=Haloimpatiens sp. FM7315 TaxID=3298609 RepID=UPI0035A3877B
MTFEKIILNNVFRNLRIYIGYLISSIFSAATFFIFSMIYYYPNYKNDALAMEKGMFLVFREVIYIITIFFVIYFLKLFVKSKKKDFGIYLTLGMDNRQLRKILFIENVVIGSISVLLGIVFGTVFLKFFLIIVSNIMGIEELKFYFSIKVILITAFRYMLLFSIISVFVGITVRFKNIIDLINFKKEENKEIEVSLAKSLLSILIIAVGYFLVFTSNINNVFSSRLLIILVVFVLGNYLFFNYILKYIIYLLSKSKRVYYNKINFLFLSSLKYRVRDNIIMLFIATVLLAVCFTSIGTAYIQMSVLKSDAIKNSPFSLNYLIKDCSKYNEDEEFIDRILQANNLKYDKVKLNILKVHHDMNENKEYDSLNLIKESEYNDIVDIINRKSVSLSKGEALLVPNYEMIYEIEEKLIGEKLKIFSYNDLVIKNNIEGCIVFKGTLLNSYIISDEDFENLYRKYNKEVFVGYEVEGWENLENINRKIKSKSEGLNKNVNNYFVSRTYIYNIEKRSNNMVIYFSFFIGSILYLAALSFINYKFHIELKEQQNKYINMMSLGLTFGELKKIISREMMVFLFIPFIVAMIDAVFAYKILYIAYEIPILKSILYVITIFFIMNFVYLFLWRFKNISFLEKR